MPELNLIRKFECRLVELGCPPARVRRSVQEIAEHFEDLKANALEEGLTAAQAEERATELLGEPMSLAERTVAGLRYSSWWGRHRVLAFGVLPALGFAPAWLLCVLVCGLVFEAADLAFGPAANAWVSSSLNTLGRHGISLAMLEILLNASLIGVFAFLFCRLATQKAVGPKWAAVACAATAVHGMFFRLSLGEHNLIIGYSKRPNWVCVATPLMIAGLFLWRHRQRELRTMMVALSLVVTTLFTGCATHREKPVVSVANENGNGKPIAQTEKPTLQRGWIGGEFKTARKDGFMTAVAGSPAVVGGLPKELAAQHRMAVRVTRLSTNTPAQLAGLKKGDYIVELNHQPVKRLRTFRRLVDRCQPGETLAVKAWRDGQWLDLQVPVGKETYRRGGTFSIMFPSVVHGWDFCFNPGLSFVFVGYEPNPGLRPALGGTKDVFQEDWKAFAGIFEVSSGKRVLAQEN